MAAGGLGYTQKTWDDVSGNEKKPASAEKYWAELTDSERAAAAVLGYTQKNWDNANEKKPASAGKSWSELTSCGESRA